MHELSIADAVVQIALSHARGRKVAKVEVKVGHLRQVVPDALAFAFDLVTTGTLAEGAELVVEEMPAAGRCRGCGEASTLAGFPLRCEHCGGADLELLRGGELLVDAIELDDLA